MAYKLDKTRFYKPYVAGRSPYTPAAAVPSVFGRTRVVESVTVHHYGADGQTTEGISSFLTQYGNATSAHFALREGIVYQLVDPKDAAWATGNAIGNATSISIECQPEMSAGDLRTLVEFIADLEKQFKRSLTIYPHNYWSATACPGRYGARIQWIADEVNKLQGKAPAQNPVGPGMIYPVTGFAITQRFNDNLTAYNSGAGHGAVDWATPVGTNLKAVADGTVVWADFTSKLAGRSWENRWYFVANDNIAVVIDHGTYFSTYSHLSITNLNIGDKVARGQSIGKSGATGNVTGPHLHFEIITKPPAWGNGYYGRVDPIAFIEARKATNSTASSSAGPDDLIGYLMTMSRADAIQLVAEGCSKSYRFEEGFTRSLIARVLKEDPGAKDSLRNLAREGGLQALRNKFKTKGLKKNQDISAEEQIAWQAADAASILAAIAKLGERMDKLEGAK